MRRFVRAHKGIFMFFVIHVFPFVGLSIALALCDYTVESPGYALWPPVDCVSYPCIACVLFLVKSDDGTVVIRLDQSLSARLPVLETVQPNAVGFGGRPSVEEFKINF
jgi:hypothetical protein